MAQPPGLFTGISLPTGQTGPSGSTISLRVIQNLSRVMGGRSAQGLLAARPLTASEAADIQRAEQQVARARMALLMAESVRAQVMAGLDSLPLRVAEGHLLTARDRVRRAEVNLKRLSGPDPVLLGSAERAVERAEATLRVVSLPRSSWRVKAGVQLVDTVAVMRAEAALQEAIERRDKVLTPPSPDELRSARQALVIAQSDLHDAALRVEALRREPPLPSPAEATATVVEARARLGAAEARLRALQDDSL
ncbi:MAG: hypothetical protein AB7P40_08425 [Chloroflexota bacterium]